MKNELNNYLRIESDRLSRRLTIPRQVNFKLTPEAIAFFENIKHNKGNIKLDTRHITDLRYYALLNSGLLDKTGNIYQQSGLIFNSCLPIGNRPSIIAIRSRIDLSGKIFQEIQQDLWQDPELLSKVMEVHYWLVEEILREIPLSTRDLFFKRQFHRPSILVWACWLPLAIALVFFFWFFLPFSFLLKAIFTVLSIVLLKLFLNYLIKDKFRSWILKQLSNGLFSQKYQQRRIGFSLLSFLN